MLYYHIQDCTAIYYTKFKKYCIFNTQTIAIAPESLKSIS